MEGRSVRVEVRGKDGCYQVVLDGRSLEVDCQQTGRDSLSLLIADRSYEVGLERRSDGFTVVFADDAIGVELLGAAGGSGAAPHRASGGPARLCAPMPGKIVRVLAAPGEQVSAEQGLVVMEAMKMENELRAPRAGRVMELRVHEGQTVETGALLAVVS